MQTEINNMYNQICKKDFLECDDEEIIGKVKNVIKYLKKGKSYINKPKNDMSDEEKEGLKERIDEIIYKLQNNYSLDDVVMLYKFPMDYFYDICDLDFTLRIIKEYYES